MNEHKTDEFFTRTDIPHLEELPPEAVRYIDIHVYEQAAPQEDTSSIESTLEERQTPTSNQQPQEQGTSRQPQNRPLKTVLGVFLILCLCGSGVMILAVHILPLLTPSATITIVPSTKQVTTTSTILIMPGQADRTRQQLQGRMLPAITMSQAQTIQTTGTRRQDARTAQGTITFYNFSTFTQTIPTGELLTGADGVQIVTDQDATISAGTLAMNGRVTVAAHTLITGPGGNIKAGDIYGPCCRMNISAMSSTFTGGQDARTYQTATTQDITSVASSLTTSLEQSVQAALQTQVQQTETLITPLPCTQSMTPDHQPGEEATQVHILVSETCTGEVYDTQSYHDLIEQMISHDATKQLGARYSQQGSIQTTILHTTAKDHGGIELQVKSVGSWEYQFSQDQLQKLTTLIVGKGKNEAINALLQSPGVQTVSIDPKQTDRLPTDEKNLHLILLETL